MSDTTTDPNAPLGGPQAPPQQPNPTAGFLNQSPDFWRTLASFGGNMAVAANARTPGGFLQYGSGLAGPMGAAVIGAMETQRQNALTASALGLQRANTADVQSQTDQRNLANSMARQRMAFLPQIMQGGGTPSFGSGAVAPTQAPTPGNTQPPASSGSNSAVAAPTGPMPLPQAIGAIEDPTGKSRNPQGFVGRYQFGTGALAAAGVYQPAPGEDLTKNQWQGNIILPARQPMTVDQFQANPAAQDQAWGAHQQNLMREMQARGLTQYIGQTVGGVPITQNTLIGMMHLGGPAGTQRFLETGGSYNPTDANGTSIAAYGQRVNTLTTGTPAQGGTAALPGAQGGKAPQPPTTGTGAPPSAMAGPMAGMPTPQQALAMADRLTQMANAQRALGLDASAIETQAQQYRALAAQIYTEQVKPQTYRAGSIGRNPYTGEQIQVPTLATGQTPQGAPTKFYAAPPPIVNGQPQGGGYAGAPISTGQPPAQAAYSKALSDEFAGPGQKSYAAAQGTLGWTAQMDHASADLNSEGGWSVTGPGNTSRMELARAVNTASQLFGGSPPFDPNKIASWEEFTKATRTAGMQLVNSQFGASREAATTIMSATQAVPSAENSPVGAKLVLNGIRETAQNEVDRHNFMTNWQQEHGGDLTGAREAFDQLATPSMYARRAISTVQPVVLRGPEEANRYLPGTYFQAKDDPTGAIRQVPMRPGMPAVPDWLSPGAQPSNQSTTEVRSASLPNAPPMTGVGMQ